MKKAFIRYFEEAFEEGKNSSKAYKVVNGVIIGLILISTLEIILSAEPSLTRYEPYLYLVFSVTSFIFLVEFVLRIYITEKQDPTFRGFAAYRRYIFNFYNLVDIIALLPFFIGIFGIDISPLWKSFRMLRIFKILRYFPSMELMINSLKNKKNILLVSMQSILFLALLLSIAIYFCENKNENSQFSSISQALLWSLAKFIGDIGGYGDFVPLTVAGQILATMNGILGIAIFALPAGIIGSGFVEEIEARQNQKKIIHDINLVKAVFSIENLAATIKNKEKYDQLSVRRKFLTINDLKYKLNLTDNDISSIIDVPSGFRIRNLKFDLPSGTTTERIVVECFECNSIYGTFFNRNSPITIIAPLSNDQPFLGHFTYAVAERLNANYISVEKFSKYEFNPKKVLDFVRNESFFEDTDIVAIQSFKEDINTILQCTKTFIIIGPKASKGNTYELLNGGKAGDGVLLREESSFSSIETLEKFSKEFSVKLSIDDMSLGIHEDNGIIGDFHLMHYLHRELDADVFQLNVSANLLKDNSEMYYKSVYVLSETIKENFQWKITTGIA